MSELLGKFPQLYALVPFAFAFVILPFVYFFLAADIHKEYADFAKSSIECEYSDVHNRTIRDRSSVDEIIAADVEVFELDWWVIAAFAVLMTFLVALGDLAMYSALLPECRLKPPVFLPVSSSGYSECEIVRFSMYAYCLFVLLAIVWRLAWARLLALRKLRLHYTRLKKISKT